MQMNLRTNSQIEDTASRLDWLLRLVVALEIPLYLGAAVLHLGVPIRLGSLVLAVPNVILPATIVETILGLAVAGNLAILIQAKPRSARITLAIHLFVLAGVTLGMVALALRSPQAHPGTDRPPLLPP
jgi:hypothetical protein